MKIRYCEYVKLTIFLTSTDVEKPPESSVAVTTKE